MAWIPFSGFAAGTTELLVFLCSTVYGYGGHAKEKGK